jgi:1-acyl-sn-glycerol-3-phosphate acyltransferase
VILHNLITFFMKSFRFNKNERGFSDLTFPFLRSTLIYSSKLLFRPKLVYPENHPSAGPGFIFGNHSNYYDPFLLNVWLYDEPTAGVMTREQFHKTIPAMFMDSVGIVPTSKYVPEPMVIRSVLKMIEQLRLIVIFPEGGRRWDGRPKPLIESTLKLFYKMNIPVYPVQLHGSYLSWPRWADFPRLSKTEIHFLKPINPSSYTDYDNFASDCRNTMNFDEYNPPEGVMPLYGYKPASGIHHLLYRCPDTGLNNGIYTPDGNRVRSRFSNFRFEMSVDSRLVDDHGERHSLIQVYDKIISLPIFKDKNEVVLRVTDTKLYTLDDKMNQIFVSLAEVTLHPEWLTIKYNSDTIQIGLDKILFMSIEGNSKLSLTLRERVWKFQINNGSALQWQIYIRKLKNHEPTELH